MLVKSETAALIELTLKKLACNQKDLSKMLGVSPTQVTKWKSKGEHMSASNEARLRELSGIGDREPDLVLLTGSVEDLQKWETALKAITESVISDEDVGYSIEPLEDTLELLYVRKYLDILGELGIEIPKPCPDFLIPDENYFPEDEDDDEDYLVPDFDNRIVEILGAITASFVDVYSFVSAWMEDLIWPDGDYLDEDFEPCLLYLAAAKAKLDESEAPNLRAFRKEWFSFYEESLTRLKAIAAQKNIPLRVELLDLVSEYHGKLGSSAESKHLFGDRQLHPDVYMNELLQGMRVIHQVLPVIMDKLNIKRDVVDLNEIYPTDPYAQFGKSEDD